MPTKPLKAKLIGKHAGALTNIAWEFDDIFIVGQDRGLVMVICRNGGELFTPSISRNVTIDTNGNVSVTFLRILSSDFVFRKVHDSSLGYFVLRYFGQGDASFCDAENEIVQNSGKRWYKGKNHVETNALSSKWGCWCECFNQPIRGIR